MAPAILFSLYYLWKDIKQPVFDKDNLAKKIFKQTYRQQAGLQEIPNFSQLVPDKEKNTTFLPEHCCCHKSDYHLISPYNLASQSHIVHKNKGINRQLKRLLIVKQVLLSTPQEIYGNFYTRRCCF